MEEECIERHGYESTNSPPFENIGHSEQIGMSRYPPPSEASQRYLSDLTHPTVFRDY
jgi:hypothetical protein